MNTYAGKVSSYIPFYHHLSSFFLNYCIVFPVVIGIIITYYIALLNLLERTEWIDISEEEGDDDNEREESSSRKRMISLKMKLLAKAKKMKKDGSLSASSVSPNTPADESKKSTEETTETSGISSLLTGFLPSFLRSIVSYLKSKPFLKKLKLFYELFTIIHEFFIHVFYIGNHYGLFANMTKIRYEINVYLGKTNYRKKRGGSSSSFSSFSPNRARISLEGVEANEDIEKDEEEESEEEDEEESESESEDERKEITLPFPQRRLDSPTTVKDKSKRKKKEKEWNQIIFSFKPDHLNYSTKTVFPFFHLPRFDWCLWFLSFKPSFLLYPKWFYHFLFALLEYNPLKHLNEEQGGSIRERDRHEDIINLLSAESKEFLLSLARDEREEEQEIEHERSKRVSSHRIHEDNDEELKEESLSYSPSFSPDSISSPLAEFDLNFPSSSTSASAAAASFRSVEKRKIKVTLSIYEYNPDYPLFAMSNNVIGKDGKSIPFWIKKNEKIFLNHVTKSKLLEVYEILCKGRKEW
jgi:hypothetical protein